MNQALATISSIVATATDRPQFVFRPKALKRAADCFLKNFTGKPMFAVKTNPDIHVLQALYNAGLRSFDVASLEEIELVRSLFDDVELYFMHPVKSRNAIREAYFEHGVRHFSLDCEAELNKILAETKHAEDLNLHVRLAIPNNFAEIALDEKFGVNLQEAPSFLKQVYEVAHQVGVCFHVGSQCMHPDAYRIAIRMASEVIEQSGIQLRFFNVGGGFPSIYPGMTPPDMEEYFAAIAEEFAKVRGSEFMQLLAEPGRALVAESSSVIVRVILRKNGRLYLNDGTYGSLFDAGVPNFIFPMKLLCDEKIYSSDLKPFSFYGPTCDSLDQMKGPFYLPSDIDEGDLIEIGQMGAYGRTMGTAFNGFAPEKEVVFVSDEPLMTMYNEDTYSVNEKLEIIAA